MLARAAKMYQNVDLESAPKTQVLDRLFERFARDLDDARTAIAAKDILAKAAAIDHAARIVIELRAALDHAAAPELAAHLDALYVFVTDKLTEASFAMNVGPLAHATRVMSTLADGFRKAHQK